MLIRKETDHQAFRAKTAIILLAGVVAIDFSSIFNISVSVIPNSLYSLKWIVSLSMVVLSVLGIIGLLLRNRMTYFALATSVSWTIFACFSLVEAYGDVMDLDLFVTSIVVATFGSGLASSVFKLDLHKQEPNNRRMTKIQLHSEDRLESVTNAIEVKNVSKKYFLGANIVSAIDGLNMKVSKGEFASIMGPSGSGKSTLLNLLGALDKPTSGQVLIDGVDISLLNDEELAHLRNEKIGFVFQAYNLIARSSVLRNMELPALVKGIEGIERHVKVKELLHIVGLNDKVSRKPKTLSGGEQQRVAIARALVNDPEIILADEPTGNVDSKTSRVIMDFLRTLNSDKGTTIIVVTHDPEVAKMTDRIIYVRDGKVISEKEVQGVSA